MQARSRPPARRGQTGQRADVGGAAERGIEGVDEGAARAPAGGTFGARADADEDADADADADVVANPPTPLSGNSASRVVPSLPDDRSRIRPCSVSSR